MKEIETSTLKTVRIGLDTHAGETGKNNEDTGAFFAYQLTDKKGSVVHLGIIADGIGGHQAGERASQMGVAVVRDYFRRVSGARILYHLDAAFRAANARIIAESQKSPDFQGMGTTMTAAVILDNCLYVAHVGDSRAYLIREGSIHELTLDHTWAQEAIDAGRLTPEEAKTHPNRHVIKRYMGIQPDMDVDLGLKHPDNGGPPSDRHQGLPLMPGDVVLLCSDGLTDLVENEHILAAVQTNPPQAAAEQLVTMARARGGYDNITVLAMQVPGRVAARGGGGMKRLGLIGGAIVALAALGVLGALAWGGDGGGAQATATPAPTFSPPALTPTGASVPRATAVPTTAVPQITPTLTASPAVTETAAPTDQTPGAATPTSVPTRTATPTPTPTNTPRPATRTPIPTQTPLPTDTSAAPPPTAQPTSPSGPPPTQPPPPQPTR